MKEHPQEAVQCFCQTKIKMEAGLRTVGIWYTIGIVEQLHDKE